MIYFLINNNFHRDNIECYLSKINDYSIINIPHNLSAQVYPPHIKVFEIATPFNRSSFQWYPWDVARAKKLINQISFGEHDVLIVQSEAEILNLYVAFSAKNKGSKVVFLEEGIASYNANMPSQKLPLSIRNQVKLFYLHYVLGLRFVSLIDFRSHITPRIADEYVDCQLFYLDATSDRKIKKELIRLPYDVLSGLSPQRCVFLSQPIYFIYCDEKLYVNAIADVMEIISPQFEKILFRFHPRDSAEVKAIIRKVLLNYDNIIVDEATSMFDSIADFRPAYAISLFSDALIKLAYSGVKPIYIYSRLECLQKLPVIESIDFFLRQIGYRNVEDLRHIADSSVVFPLPQNTHTLLDFLGGG